MPAEVVFGKEIRSDLNTDEHDFNFKLKHPSTPKEVQK